MSKPFDIVFFDMGHTLAFFYPSVGEIAAQAWTEVGLPTTADQAGMAVRQVWKEEDENASINGYPATQEYDEQAEYERSLKVMHLLGGSGETMVRAYLKRVNQLFVEPNAIQLFDDVLPALDHLQSAGYRLGIISNWSWNLIDRCKQVGIDGYFEVIMASAYAGVSKPHPRIFQLTLEQAGVSPDQAVHVGDLYHADIVGARAANMTGVLLDRKGESEKTDCPVVQDLWGLIDWLNSR